jgi:hypothetical protein
LCKICFICINYFWKYFTIIDRTICNV